MTQQTDQSRHQLDALRLARELRETLVGTAMDGHYVRDPAMSKALEALWRGSDDASGLVSDLWVEPAFPSKPSDLSLRQLAGQGIFHPDLARHLDHPDRVPGDRRLYTHQAQAVLDAAQRDNPALVISASTGAGKTEAFLLPMLNRLYSTPGTPGQGIRCLILYPMNALVNDQVDRLYQWLQGQDQVRFTQFTSETPETLSDAKKAGFERYDPCRAGSRQEARGWETHDGRAVRGGLREVPDILITNYSMLEYMLCRPQDSVFFGSNLSTIVLDEAHLYSGTLAAEICLLQRRLLERCGRRSSDLLHIATSATIGGDGEVLQRFAADLFTKDREAVCVVRGEHQEIELPTAKPAQREVVPGDLCTPPEASLRTIEANASGAPSLLTSPEGVDALADFLRPLATESRIAACRGAANDVPAKFLWHILRHAAVVHRVVETLSDGKLRPVKDLANAVWGTESREAQEATGVLLRLCASAREDISKAPLVPHRLHVLARGAAGVSACLGRACTAPEIVRVAVPGDADPITVVDGIHGSCPHCEAVTLAVVRCRNCGEWGVVGREFGGRMELATGTTSQEVAYWSLRVPADCAGPVRGIDPVNRTVGAAKAPNRVVEQVHGCPGCEEPVQERWHFLRSAVEPTLTAAVETILREVPPYPNDSARWLPAKGRRLLAFSDSRQQAARLGPGLSAEHDAHLFRAAIMMADRDEDVVDDALVDYLRASLREAHAQQGASGHSASLVAVLKRKIEALDQELAAATTGGSLALWAARIEQGSLVPELLDFESAGTHQARAWRQIEWERNAKAVAVTVTARLIAEIALPSRRRRTLETLGLIEVTYPRLESVTPPPELLGSLPSASHREMLGQVWSDLMATLCDTLRGDGAVAIPDDSLPYLNAEPYRVGFWMSADTSDAARLQRFVGSTRKQHRRAFVEDVLRGVGMPEDEVEKWAPKVLAGVFEQLLNLARTAEFAWIVTDEREAGAGTVPAVRIVAAELCLKRNSQIFQSQSTRHVFPRSVLKCAPVPGCDDLKLMSASDLDHDARLGWYRRRYRDGNTMGLWAEEHSAQLSTADNRRLQDLFKMGARNVLSSTTTLELGIDIGGLNAALMANVPPSKANYVQRAGRAGRRADGSAVVVTFARDRPFDRAVFANFAKYIERDFRRPEVLLDRPRIVNRHTHAYLLGEFFRQVYGAGATKGAMEAFGKMGVFTGERLPQFWDPSGDKPSVPRTAAGLSPPHPPVWWVHENKSLAAQFEAYLAWLEAAPDSVQRLACSRIRGGLDGGISDWTALVAGTRAAITSALATWQDDYRTLNAAWKGVEAEDPNGRAQANAIRYQLQSLFEEHVIAALATRQFLPRYGFPVNLLKLVVHSHRTMARARASADSGYRLERAGQQALREYAPGSEITVGGRVVRSRGLLRHHRGGESDNSFGLGGRYATCEREHVFYAVGRVLGLCPICGGAPTGRPKNLIQVKHGFTTAAWDPPRRGIARERVGLLQQASTEIATRAGDESGEVQRFGGVPRLRGLVREGGELFLYNEGDDGAGFIICTRCGFSTSEKERGKDAAWPSAFQQHRPLWEAKKKASCVEPTTGKPLRHRTLASIEVTDLVSLDFSSFVGDPEHAEGIATTLAYALQQGGAGLLEIDERELGVLVVAATEATGGYASVVYDTAAGGAGHALDLHHRGRDWLVAAREALWVSEHHHARCETACLDCLLTFQAQHAAERGLLLRRRAYDVLDAVLTDGDTQPGVQREPAVPLPEPPVVGRSSRSDEERLARGRARTQGRNGK